MSTINACVYFIAKEKKVKERNISENKDGCCDGEKSL